MTSGLLPGDPVQVEECRADAHKDLQRLTMNLGDARWSRMAAETHP